MKLNVDLKVRRISSGYIVTGNDSSKTQTFYKTLPELMVSLTEYEARDSEKDFVESLAEGYEFDLIIKTTHKLLGER